MVEKETEMNRPKFNTEAEEAEWLYDHRVEIDTEWAIVRDEQTSCLRRLKFANARSGKNSANPPRKKPERSCVLNLTRTPRVYLFDNRVITNVHVLRQIAQAD